MGGKKIINPFFGKIKIFVFKKFCILKLIITVKDLVTIESIIRRNVPKIMKLQVFQLLNKPSRHCNYKIEIIETYNHKYNNS